MPPVMSSECLVAQLRAFPQFYRIDGSAAWVRSTGKEPLCLEAADRIEALEATIRVQEAQIESLQQTP